MNFQQEKQLAGESPRTWLSSTDKMCTTDSLAWVQSTFNLCSSSPVSIDIGGAGVFPICRSCRRWVHMLLLGFATFEHNYRFYSDIYI